MRANIVICGSPRTGGKLLCDLLRAAGVGFGDEWASPHLFSMYSNRYQVSGKEAVWKEIWAATSVSGNFILKLHWPDMNYSHVNRDLLSCVPSGVPTLFIYQFRDVVDQARSWALARQTGIWFRKDPNPMPPIAQMQDFLECQELVRAQDKNWKTWFSENKILPIFIEYDSLIAAPSSHVAHIKRWVDRIPYGGEI